jgi:hypothetical protein
MRVKKRNIIMNENLSCGKTLKMTRHFIERYYERVLGEKPSSKLNPAKLMNQIYSDIENKLLERERIILEMFRFSKSVRVPFSRQYQLIVRNNTLITIYSFYNK